LFLGAELVPHHHLPPLAESTVTIVQSFFICAIASLAELSCNVFGSIARVGSSFTRRM
jgi:hypothetical protein